MEKLARTAACLMLGFGEGSSCQNLVATHVDFAVLDIHGDIASFLAVLSPFTTVKNAEKHRMFLYRFT